MDSNTFQLTCPICGRSDIGSYQSHLQTHSKQALIDMLISQSQIITPNDTPVKGRGVNPEFISVDNPGNTAEDADHPGGSTRRSSGTPRHGQTRSPRIAHSRRISTNPLELDSTSEISSTSRRNHLDEQKALAQPSGTNNFPSCPKAIDKTAHEFEIRASIEAADPQVIVSENSTRVSLPQYTLTHRSLTNDEIQIQQLEEDDDNMPFDEEQVLEFVSEECSAEPIYVHEGIHNSNELEVAATSLTIGKTSHPIISRPVSLPQMNFIKYIVDESRTKEAMSADPGVKWIFPDGVAVPVYSSFQHIPSSSSSSASHSGVRCATDEDSSLSLRGNGRARNVNSSDVDLMTDEEIPPRGEISEYEESNTSSLLSDDSKHGLLSSSLGSMFSDRVRRLSPVVDLESLSSHSKAAKRLTKASKSTLSMTSSFGISEGHRCRECVHDQYFSSIFELAQHQAELHPKPFNSVIHKQDAAKSEVHADWRESYRKPVASTQSGDEGQTVMVKHEPKRSYKRKEFSCLYCVYSTYDKKTLGKHVTAEHEGKMMDPNQFECTTCGKLFVSRNNLVKHLLVHRGKRHSCTTCNRAFTSQFKLKEHFRVHTKDYPFACTQCERTFRTPSLRTAHIKRVHEGIKVVKQKQEFYCPICHRVLHSKAGLLSHAHTHLETASKCPYCKESFLKGSILIRHIRTVHDSAFESKESKECPICLKMLHPNSMKSHLRIHKGEKPFPCQVCSMTFRTYANLTSHSWSHTNMDKPFKCKKCPKSYLFQKYLDSHMIVHKRRTSHFTCNECGVKFTSKMNMKRHIEEHFKEKKFKCKSCGKCFHRKYYLSEHERIHSNLKPFSCSICGKTSTTKSNHRSHVKIHDARESGTLEG